MKQDLNELHHYVEVQNELPQSFRILGSTSERRKFILNNKNSFTFDVEDSVGSVNVYIGLDPQTVGKKNHVWMAEMDE